jgi:AmmeMemoRadiSam system protein A
MSPLNEDEQRCLLTLARQAIASVLCDTVLDVDAAAAVLPSCRLADAGAAFVSLHRHGNLRGCVGFIASRQPLYQTVVEAARAAAFHDQRFSPLQKEEFTDVEIEISVLSPFFPVVPEDVRPGEHGLMVSLGSRRGLLLPQVASERGWTRERFLEETCTKAGLERDAWKRGALIEAFTACVFSESSLAAHPAPQAKK